MTAHPTEAQYSCGNGIGIGIEEGSDVTQRERERRCG